MKGSTRIPDGNLDVLTNNDAPEENAIKNLREVVLT